MRQTCAEHLWGRTPFGRYRLQKRVAIDVFGARPQRPQAPFATTKPKLAVQRAPKYHTKGVHTDPLTAQETKIGQN